MLETRIKKANKKLKYILLSIAIAFMLFLLTIGSLCLFAGYKVIWVKGDSAIQGIKPFSLILVKPCEVEDLTARDYSKNINMGDFAVRYFGSGYVTHEVCEKYYDEETNTWYFDTVQAGDGWTQTDGTKAGSDFTQKDLVGKVVAKESFIGKLLAWVQGYPNISTTLGGPQNKTLAIVRILTLAIILYGITKFAEFVYFKEDIC